MSSPELPLSTDSKLPVDGLSGAVLFCIKGEVLRIIFAADDGLYTVLRLLDDNGREHTLVGPMGGVGEGQDIEASGKWESHKEHGKQFRVLDFKAILPTSEEGIRRYLSSGVIPGIGPKLAERIIDHFGMETIEILDKYSNRLKEVPGIGKKKIKPIKEAWDMHERQRELYIFLQGLHIGPGLCARLIKHYGVGTAEVIRNSPYQMASEVRGVGFLTADRIAGEMGIETTDIMRLSCGIGYTLEKLSERGHVCYPLESLMEEAAKTLAVDLSFARAGLQRAVDDGIAVVETEGNGEQVVFQRELCESERELADHIRRLLCSRPRSDTPSPGGNFYQQLNEEQKQAVSAAFAGTLSIITGGPGVGKTTVVGQIVSTARSNGWYTLLAAPTGRAAKRLSESSRLDAKTIHRLLKWNPQEGRFVHNMDKPLRCDMLIVDEVSMLDVNLACQLLRAVSVGTHVVFVGDRDQLPSVGPGAVLHDLIMCGCIPVTHLVRIYRQDENSRIVSNAHAVNQGSMPDLRAVPKHIAADFYWIDQEDPEKVAATIAEMVRTRIPKRFRFHPMRDIQVLTPMNRGCCGALALNELMQKELNPGPKPEFRSGERVYRSGDRVMQIVNNYDKSVFNGDLGYVREINQKEKTFSVQFDVGMVEYEFYESDQLRLAYAVTVHKSQGSEFPVVVMPVVTQHFVMLQRNLIYTGMTRAKKLLIMIGTRKALAMAVGNNKPMMRCTRLVRRLSTSMSDWVGS